MLEWLDDVARLVPDLWMWKTYAVALWHTLRKPVSRPIHVCTHPRSCRKAHRLVMVMKRGKPGYFVLVH